MGFRTGAYAKIWEIKPVFDTNTKCRVSISRKVGENQYEQDFSGYVAFVGTAAAKKAACLKEGASIKLGDVDVTTKYDKDKETTYTNYKCFSFELADEAKPTTEKPASVDEQVVDDGEIDDSNVLPF